ncbi:MAG: PHB depolymerase family esterase [Casimicrobiaceae bacterium]
MQQMREGNLQGATAAIQRGLARMAPGDAPDHAGAAKSDQSVVIDGDYVDVSTADTTADTRADSTAAPREEAAPSDRGHAPTLHTGLFKHAAGAREYLVYAPAVAPTEPAPLLLMLHGCTQSATDFARGTQMHLHAARQGYVVVYPLQSRRDNPNGCWNWFRPGDQQREAGEPALLAGLMAEMGSRFHGDARRVYVAGLSAGGAMAVTLAQAYPEVFRGVGVHSGLPYGCARDIPSALAAMRAGSGAAPNVQPRRTSAAGVPTIVFHGDRDATVNVANASRIVTAALAPSTEYERAQGDVATATRPGQVPGGHAFTTTRWTNPDGALRAERWIVHGGGHAWYGGNAEGSYTDARGPDASAEMLRFFGELAGTR